MSLLTDLLDRLEMRDPELGRALRDQVAVLGERRSFGLNFEQHIPETVELPGRAIRRGDKVRLRRVRGARPAVGESLRVTAVSGRGAARRAAVVPIGEASGGDSVEHSIADLVCVADFRDPIYPGLQSLGKIECGGEKPFHSVLKAENFHALEMLLFPHAGQVDLIYIDPPYNTGATKWKYNNNYVDESDRYRHSKWLAFMERRLRLAKLLLRPSESVLLVTIDDKELNRLGLLLEQVFPGTKRQIVDITVSPRGKSKASELSQVDEYMFVLYFGAARMTLPKSHGEESEVRWRYLRRNDIESARGTKKGGPRQFYPIYVDEQTKRIVALGDPLTPDQDRSTAPKLAGATAVFPLTEDGVEMNWGLTAPSLQKALEAGFVRVTPGSHANQPYTFAYLTGPNVKKIESGELAIRGERADGSKIVVQPTGKAARPTTVWRDTRYDAGSYGTAVLGELIPGRKFPYPKSIYAVEDALRYFVGANPSALVLDFFAGSGTTAHALARLNQEDDGARRSICVTNNEVSPEEAEEMEAQGLSPGDPEWEARGIYEFITRPRIEAAITGKTPAGDPVGGEYKFGVESPMAAGLEENVEFFELTYKDPHRIELDMEFAAIASLLWMRAGSRGERIDKRRHDFALAPSYGILFDVDFAEPFVAAIAPSTVPFAFVITDDEAQFQSIAAELPARVESVRLYESLLRTAEVNTGRH